MSLIYKCDICGKDSAMGGVEFSDGAMLLKLPNYDNKIMRIYMQLNIEAQADFDKIQQAKEQIKEISANLEEDVDIEEVFEEAFEDAEIYEELNQIKINLDNPFPMICNCCKKLIAKDILLNVEFPNSIKTCAGSSARTEAAAKQLDKMNLNNGEQN